MALGDGTMRGSLVEGQRVGIKSDRLYGEADRDGAGQLCGQGLARLRLPEWKTLIDAHPIRRQGLGEKREKMRGEDVQPSHNLI